LISPQSRKGRKDSFSFHLPLIARGSGIHAKANEKQSASGTHAQENIIFNYIHNSWTYGIDQFEAQLWVLPAGLESFYLPASQRQIKK